jgi:hypothetical protein
MPRDILQMFREAGRQDGKFGGKRSLETMTPEERTARAKRAAAVLPAPLLETACKLRPSQMAGRHPSRLEQIEILSATYLAGFE